MAVATLHGVSDALKTCVGWQECNESADIVRRLGEQMSAADEKAYNDFSKAAQIFSGAMFSVLVVYLIFSNSTRLSYIQRASLEKRLNVICQINIIVAWLSAFLNLFQVTEVDNWLLPGSRSMTVDVARPVEWILTCPLMQLSLVLMGGSRIPEWRRVAMPLSSVCTLSLASLNLFIDPLWARIILYFFGCCSHGTAMYFNRLQILEHSRGAEGLLSGDSEFRKATLILMLTWVPFPLWYILSPEGIGFVDDIALIQMGWAFLNIAAKFGLIFYMQRVRDNYCTRLKVKREMGAYKGTGLDDGENGNVEPVEGGLRACVCETLGFLGMAENIDRFLRLLTQAEITSFQKIEGLTQEDCDRLQLPIDLVEAIQTRQRVWALELVDSAERDLESCEKHYNEPEGGKKSPRSMLADGQTLPAPSAYSSLNSIVPYGMNDKSRSGSDTPMFGSPMFDLPASTIGFNQDTAAATSGFNSGAMVQTASFNREATTMNQGAMEKRLDKFEQNMMDKFEVVIQSVGKKVEQQINTSMDRQKLEMQTAMERPRRGSVGDIQGQLEQFTQQIQQRVTSTRDTSSAATEALQASLDIVAQKLELIQDQQNNQMSNLESSLMRMLDGWAQNSVQESRGVAQQTQMSVKQLQASIEGSKSTSVNVEQKMSQFTKDVEQKLGSFKQDFQNSIERSQSNLESNMGLVFEAKLKENRQSMQVDLAKMHSQMEQHANTVTQAIEKDRRTTELRATASREASREASAASAETFQASLEIMSNNLQQLQDSQTTSLSSLGGSLQHMMDGWAQNTMQELSLQKQTSETNMAQKIDGLLKRSQEQLASQMQQQDAKMQQQLMYLQQQMQQQSQGGDMQRTLDESMENMRNMMAQQKQASDSNTQSKLDGMLKRSHEQLKAQMEQQCGMMRQQFTEQSQLSVVTTVDRVNNMLASTIKDSAEKAIRTQMDGFKDLHEFMEDVARRMIVSARTSANMPPDAARILGSDAAPDFLPGLSRNIRPSTAGGSGTKRQEPVHQDPPQRDRRFSHSYGNP